MRVVKTASGKKVVKISRQEWEKIGKTAGWFGDQVSGFKEKMIQSMTQKAGAVLEKTLNILDKTAQQSDEQQKNAILSVINSIRSAEGVAAKFQAVKKAYEYLRQFQNPQPQNPQQATASGSLDKIEIFSGRPAGFHEQKRKFERQQKKEQQAYDATYGNGAWLQKKQQEEAQMLKELAAVPDKAAAQASIALDTLATREIGGVSGGTVLTGINAAMQALSLAYPSLETLSMFFGTISNLVSKDFSLNPTDVI